MCSLEVEIRFPFKIHLTVSKKTYPCGSLSASLSSDSAAAKTQADVEMYPASGPTQRATICRKSFNHSLIVRTSNSFSKYGNYQITKKNQFLFRYTKPVSRNKHKLAKIPTMFNQFKKT